MEGQKGVSWEAGLEYTWGKLSANASLEPFTFGRFSSWEKEKIALEVISIPSLHFADVVL